MRVMTMTFALHLRMRTMSAEYTSTVLSSSYLNNMFLAGGLGWLYRQDWPWRGWLADLFII